MAAGDVTETEGGSTITVDDAVVTQLQFGHVFGIQLRGGAAVQIDQPFCLGIGGRELGLVPPGDVVHEVGAALPLFDMTVDRIRIARLGTLQLSFRVGAEVEVPTNPHDESWSVSLPGVGLWGGLPGGGVAMLPTPPKPGIVG